MPTRLSMSRRLIAEGTLIVASILLAFAIDAWWDELRDRAREQEYLALLASDLRSTLSTLERFAPIADTRFDPANARLVRAYYQRDLPPADSIRAWLERSRSSVGTPLSLGTVESIIATGDIALIRDDSLRIEIGDYLRSMRAFDGTAQEQRGRVRDAAADLLLRVDVTGLSLSSLSSAQRDSLAGADPLVPYPVGDLRRLPAPDFEAVIRDPVIHSILERMLEARVSMRTQRGRMREQTEHLLARVEAARSR